MVNGNAKETDARGENLEKMAGSINTLATRCDEIGITCLVYIATRSSSPVTSSFYDPVDCFEFPGVMSWMSLR
jgi:hypothetical protein